MNTRGAYGSGIADAHAERSPFAVYADPLDRAAYGRGFREGVRTRGAGVPTRWAAIDAALDALGEDPVPYLDVVSFLEPDSVPAEEAALRIRSWRWATCRTAAE